MLKNNQVFGQIAEEETVQQSHYYSPLTFSDLDKDVDTGQHTWTLFLEGHMPI